MREATQAELDRLKAGHYWLALRAEVQDVDGNWVRLDTLGGLDWVKGADWGASIDEPVQSGTLRLFRERGTDATESLAPLIEASGYNRDALGGYAPLLHGGRRLRLYTAVTDPGGDFSTAWKPVLEGKVDRVKWPGHVAALEFRDLGAILQDTQIQEARVYGSAAGTAVETVMQEILDDNNTGVTLYTPVSPGWMIHEFEQAADTNVLDALLQLARQIGWEVRYMYDAADQFRLTFYRPERNPTAPDHTFTADDYLDVTGMDSGDTRVRNQVRLFSQDVDGNPLVSYREDPASVLEFGPRYMEVPEEKTSNIDTQAELDDLGDIILSDLASPPASQETRNTYFWPVQVADFYRWTANGYHYDTDQDLAVQGYKHEVEGGTGHTSIQVRGKPAGAYNTWLRDWGARARGVGVDVRDVSLEWDEDADVLRLVGTGVGRVRSARFIVDDSLDFTSPIIQEDLAMAGEETLERLYGLALFTRGVTYYGRVEVYGGELSGGTVTGALGGAGIDTAPIPEEVEPPIPEAPGVRLLVDATTSSRTTQYVRAAAVPGAGAEADTPLEYRYRVVQFQSLVVVDWTAFSNMGPLGSWAWAADIQVVRHKFWPRQLEVEVRDSAGRTSFASLPLPPGLDALDLGTGRVRPDEPYEGRTESPLYGIEGRRRTDTLYQGDSILRADVLARDPGGLDRTVGDAARRAQQGLTAGATGGEVSKNVPLTRAVANVPGVRDTDGRVDPTVAYGGRTETPEYGIEGRRRTDTLYQSDGRLGTAVEAYEPNTGWRNTGDGVGRAIRGLAFNSGAVALNVPLSHAAANVPAVSGSDGRIVPTVALSGSTRTPGDIDTDAVDARDQTDRWLKGVRYDAGVQDGPTSSTWYRVVRNTASSGRAAYRVMIRFTGGNATPTRLIFDVVWAWSGQCSITQVSGGHRGMCAAVRGVWDGANVTEFQVLLAGTSGTYQAIAEIIADRALGSSTIDPGWGPAGAGTVQATLDLGTWPMAGAATSGHGTLFRVRDSILEARDPGGLLQDTGDGAKRSTSGFDTSGIIKLDVPLVNAAANVPGINSADGKVDPLVEVSGRAFTPDTLDQESRSKGQNLMGVDAGPEVSWAGNKYVLPARTPLEDLGLLPGDKVSASADIKTAGGASQKGQIGLYFWDAANLLISTHFGVDTNLGITEYERVTAQATIPSNATSIGVLVDDAANSGGTFWSRRHMLNRGTRAMDFEEPPFRPQRETADDVGDGAARRVTYHSEAAGGARGYAGLDSAGDVNRDVPLARAAANLVDISSTSGRNIRSQMLRVDDVRSVNEPPSHYYSKGRMVISEFKQVSFIGAPLVGTYCQLTTYSPWTDPSGGPVKQEALGEDGEKVRRFSTSSTTWGPWRRSFEAQEFKFDKDTGNADVELTQSDGTQQRVIAKGHQAGTGLVDGAGVTFNPVFQNPPMILLRGGLTYNASISGDQALDRVPQNVSASGFVLRAKNIRRGSVTTHTDNFSAGSIARASPIGTSVNCNLDPAGASGGEYTVKYTFQADTANDTTLSLTFAIDTNDGSGWVERATQRHLVAPGSVNWVENVQKQITVSGLGVNDDIRLRFKADSSSYGQQVSTWSADPSTVEYPLSTDTEEPATLAGAYEISYEAMAVS